MAWELRLIAQVCQKWELVEGQAGGQVRAAVAEQVLGARFELTVLKQKLD